MGRTLRAGVIGAGVFGGYHARQYVNRSDVAFAGVFDPDAAAGQALIAAVGGQAFESLETLLAEADVVSITSPAMFHADQGLAAVTAGRHVYVEKPIATDVRAAERLAVAAGRAGVVLANGHQERVVFQAMGLLDAPAAPLRVEAVRHGPPSSRSRDVSAVLDLMIHDIDLVLRVSGSEPVAAEAEGERAGDGVWDSVRAEVSFESGLVALFDVSRQAPARRRILKLVYASGEVEVDFVARTFRNTTPFDLNADFASTPAATDPLGASLTNFLAVVRGEIDRPLVTAVEAIAALDLTLAVEMALGNAG